MGGTASCAGATVESNTRLEKATSSAVRIGMSLVVATGAGGEDTRVDAGPQRLISIRDSSASRLVAGANERGAVLYGLEQRLHLRDAASLSNTNRSPGSVRSWRTWVSVHSLDLVPLRLGAHPHPMKPEKQTLQFRAALLRSPLTRSCCRMDIGPSWRSSIIQEAPRWCHRRAGSSVLAAAISLRGGWMDLGAPRGEARAQ